MKNTNQIVTSQVAPPAVSTAAVETVRPLGVLKAAFDYSGDKATLRKGEALTPAEYADVIASTYQEGQTLGVRARWMLYGASKTIDEKKLKEIVDMLTEKLSRSAAFQLKSEALTLCPEIERLKLATPISLLKDASAAFKRDKKTGDILPLDKQSKAGALLLPMLQSGKDADGKPITQAAIRKIRAEIPKKQGGTKTPAPASTPAASTMTQVASLLFSLKAVAAKVTTFPMIGEEKTGVERMDAGDIKAAYSMLTDICRKVGGRFEVTEVNKS